MEATLKITSGFYETTPEEKSYSRFPSFTKEEIFAPKKLFWEKIKSFIGRTDQKEEKGECYFYTEGQETYTGVYIISRTFQSVDILRDFDLYNEEEVYRFISVHPEINSYLNFATKIISKYFQFDRLELQLINDYDSKLNDVGTLFLYIPTSLSSQEALNLLEKVEEEFYDSLEIDPTIFNLNLRSK